MEVQVKQLTDMTKRTDKSSVWQKLGASTDEMYEQHLADCRKRSSKTREPTPWHTSNAEYGRFHRNQMGSTKGEVPIGSSPELKHTDGAPVWSRVGAGSQGNATSEHAQINPLKQNSTSGTKLPPINPKFIGIVAAKENNNNNNQAFPTNKPLQTWQHQTTVNAGADNPRKRLTTGFAKGFMQYQCKRLWNNMQTVAEDAGFDISSRHHSAADTQILTIEHDNNEEALESQREDDEYSHSIPSPATSLSPSGGGSRNNSSKRQRDT